MQGFQFHVIKEQGLDVIIIQGSPVSIMAHDLSAGVFKAKPGQMVLYGHSRGRMLAFDLQNWQNASAALQLELASMALNWYAKEILNLPDMDINLEDPRPIHLKIVN